MADFLDEKNPADRDSLSRLVAVIEFNDEAQREAYIAHEINFGVDLESEQPVDESDESRR